MLSLVYNTENICNVDTNMIQFTINDKVFLDFLLVKKRGKSISYSAVKKKKILKKRACFIGFFLFTSKHLSLDMIFSKYIF